MDFSAIFTLPHIIFAVVVTALLAFDIYSHRSEKEISLKSATGWSAFYIVVALAFAGYIAYAMSYESAQLFLTGYALEKVLAVDNLFAFMMVFAYFGVESKYQHRILYWGIIGAIIFRAIFVALGTGATFLFGPWAELLFAAIIGWTAFQMLKGGDDEEDGDDEPDYQNAFYLRALKKFLPVTDKTNGSAFFIKDTFNGKVVWAATPMFLCLIAIEFSDVIFAFDSVPAIIAVTQEPFLIFAAMIFAILGLRSLYFVLEALKNMMSKLETMVIVILAFIAGKLGIAAGSKLAMQTGLLDIKEPWHLHPGISLAIVMTLLGIGIVWSLIDARNNQVTEA